MPKNEIQAAVDRFARERGMERRGNNWYKRSSEVVAVLNLQKSQYGPSYYVNVGFSFSPAEHFVDSAKAPISGRAGRLQSLPVDQFDALFDLEEDMAPEDRADGITAVCEELWPLFERGSSIEGLASLVQEGQLPRSMVTKAATERLP